jgi:hypothetical protein
VKITTPEEILDSARRRVDIREKKRYFALYWGIGSSALYIAFFAFNFKDPQACFQSIGSFIWGFLFGVFISLLPVPGAMCVALFLRKYADEYILSKRLIELEEEKSREGKSRRLPGFHERPALKKCLTEQNFGFLHERGRKAKTISPEKILEKARRRVDLSEPRRYFTLFLGIGWCVLLVGVIAFFGEEPEAYFNFNESFVWGIIFSIMAILVAIPIVVGVGTFYHKYHYDYIVSKRIIELEEEKLRESES